MTAVAYQSRKKFVRQVNRDLRGREVKRMKWPELKEGEFVYYVKSLVGKRELKWVAASSREEAEFKTFPGAPLYELRSMPVHAYAKPLEK